MHGVNRQWYVIFYRCSATLTHQHVSSWGGGWHVSWSCFGDTAETGNENTAFHPKSPYASPNSNSLLAGGKLSVSLLVYSAVTGILLPTTNLTSLAQAFHAFVEPKIIEGVPSIKAGRLVLS